MFVTVLCRILPSGSVPNRYHLILIPTLFYLKYRVLNWSWSPLYSIHRAYVDITKNRTEKKILCFLGQKLHYFYLITFDTKSIKHMCIFRISIWSFKRKVVCTLKAVNWHTCTLSVHWPHILESTLVKLYVGILFKCRL